MDSKVKLSIALVNPILDSHLISVTNKGEVGNSTSGL